MRNRTTLMATMLFFCVTFVLMGRSSSAGIFDRVVAFVNNQAITLSEFQEQYQNTLKIAPDVTEEDVINTMINRILLLDEARKYRIVAPTEDEMVKEYIDLKVRAFITVGEQEMETFYQNNRSRFAGKDYEDVRGEIENYLTEKKLNERLKETLAELRKKAYIKIQLKPE
ncbi:MAG: SurA N-terminal domain-containing protein [Candidatus Sulfobium sp.]|jgi:SurA-like N-terminal domain